ncbi:outer dynein arm-docking complex subunit 4-like [Coccinella septempunctata]|uniref:outer dynein arm-docking complex subunit 4-like n=1 Tax=Coccinella septempunctata TaxID=41139 RepID=UPI001D0807D7|nr:outer dynein arm-docking complex subunit 4-like [Coccinella septempunctata]
MPKVTFNIEKLNETFNWPVYYREVGYYVRRREEYERSLKYFDQSLKKEPDSIRTLKGRANARAKAVKFTGALEDIQRILTLEPENIYLKAERALITYLGCEFEDALIQNYRNVPLRQKPDNFVMGCMHCEDAILNCISERAGKPLRDHFKIIRKIAWTKTIENQRPFKPVAKYRKKRKRSMFVVLPTSVAKSEKKKKDKEKSDEEKTGLSDTSTGKLMGSLAMIVDSSSIKDSLYSHESSLNQLRMPPAPPFPHRPMQNRTSNIDNYIAERYLNKLYQDKQFLKILPNSSGTMIANEKGSLKIKQLAIQGYKNVYNTQEMLRARRPFYFIKYQEARSCGKLDQRRQHTLRLLQDMATKQADYMISKIQDELKNRKVRRLFEFAEKLVSFCETTSKKVFPKRQQYMSRMLDMVCEAFYVTKKFSKNMTEEQKEDRIKLILGLPMEKFPSTDSLANDMKGWFLDYKKMSAIYEKRLFRAESPEELAWLYHELSRFSFELKKYELARMYARKCITEANTCKKLKWIMNAMILIVRIDIVQKNKNDAKNQAKHAKKIATRLKDDEMADFLERCVNSIEESTMDDMLGTKLLEMREKQIIKLLTTQKMKDEAAYLFRRISTLPMNKRMSVMPGFTFADGKSRKFTSSESLLGDVAKKEEGKAAGTKKTRGVAFLNFL